MNARVCIAGVLLFTASMYFAHQGVIARQGIDHLPMPFDQKTPERLSGFSLVSALGGMRRVAADLSYVEQLQYFGNVDRWRADSFVSYRYWGDEILWLDPYFYHAIEENAVVLGFLKGDKQRSMDYLRRAAGQDLKHERYQELIGALLYQSKNQPNKTIALLKKDILRGTASEMFMRIVGNIYLKYEDWAAAKKYWNWMCPRVKQEVTLKRCVEVALLLKKKGY